MSYLEVPLLASFRVGQNSFKLSVGSTIGVALNGKVKTTLNVDGESSTTGRDLNIGNEPNLDDVKPFDVNANLGITKVVSLAEQPMEISLNLQPSLTKWMPNHTAAYYGRYITASVRVAYFIPMK